MYIRVSADTGIYENFMKYSIYKKVCLILIFIWIIVTLFKYLSEKSKK